MIQRVNAKSPSGEEVELSPEEWMQKSKEGYTFVGVFYVLPSGDTKKNLRKVTIKGSGCGC